MAKFCCNIAMVITIGIHDSDKKLFMSQCFQQKEYTFGVLSFIQMRTFLTDKN